VSATRGAQAAAHGVTEGVAGEHGDPVAVVEGDAEGLDEVARDGPQLRGHAVAAVEHEGVVDRALVGGQIELGLDGEHEVGLAVAVEVGLGVHAALFGRQGDVDAEVVHGAEAAALGDQLDPVAEVAAVELGPSGCAARPSRPRVALGGRRRS
jgi:hypothetical protein